MSKLTKEQQTVVDIISSDSCDFMKVSACSGSGKTHTLTEIVKELKPSNGLYIAYNKAIATEASQKFPSSVDCRTTHSLAYASTVRPYGLRVGYFGYRDIKAKLPYDNKLQLVDHISKFCLSVHLTFKAYCKENDVSPRLETIGTDILAEMAAGETTCTHEFYLKLYHILLVNGDVVHEEFDLLMLDEAGDLNPVTLQIFKELPAKKKVMVGDPNQNIYSFNNTINGFIELAGEGVLMGLTQSFRVSDHIATAMEAFARDTFDPDMNFKGVIHKDKSISTKAYISRTNGQLIDKMMELNLMDKPYNLVRPVKSIFALPLALIGLKKGGFIANPQYKFLQEDVEDYFKDAKIQKAYTTPLAYIAYIHEENPGIMTAINMLTKHGPRELIDAQATALKYEKSNKTYQLTLCTSHSSKGLEFDMVEIAYDTTSTLTKILAKSEDKWTPQDMEEFRLFYVAATRAKKELIGAKHLEKYTDVELGLHLL